MEKWMLGEEANRMTPPKDTGPTGGKTQARAGAARLKTWLPGLMIDDVPGSPMTNEEAPTPHPTTYPIVTW